jgi:hypothetical protein
MASLSLLLLQLLFLHVDLLLSSLLLKPALKSTSDEQAQLICQLCFCFAQRCCETCPTVSEQTVAET